MFSEICNPRNYLFERNSFLITDENATVNAAFYCTISKLIQFLGFTKLNHLNLFFLFHHKQKGAEYIPNLYKDYRMYKEYFCKTL